MQADQLRRILGANVRRLRLEMGLTQVELAERLNVGQNYISDVETGKKSPLLKTLAEFAEILQVQPSELLTSKDTVAA